MNLFLCKNLISLSLVLKTAPRNLYRSNLFFSSRPSKSNSLLISDYLVNRHGFSAETSLKASAIATRIRSPEKSDLVLAFLEQSGFSKTHLEKLIKTLPSILSSDLERTIKPKIKVFQDFGFSPNDVADIIADNAWTLRRSAAKRLIPSLTLLKDIVGTNSDVSRVIKRSAWFLHLDLQKTIIPNIELMKSCGICGSQIIKFLFNYPRFLILKPDNFKALVERVDELGFDRKSRMYIHAIRVLSSMTRETWELKLKLFRSLGWSEDDILFVFRRIPAVFSISDKKIREGARFLLKMGTYNPSFLVLHPEMLIFSLEGRIKPRVQILGILESKNLISKSYSLPSILKMSDEQFSKKYVLPYANEVGELYA